MANTIFSITQLVSIVVLFLMILGLEKEKRRYRRWRTDRPTEDKTVPEIAAETGLSELQIQVAMDAAITTFHQRITEMMHSAR